MPLELSPNVQDHNKCAVPAVKVMTIVAIAATAYNGVMTFRRAMQLVRHVRAKGMVMMTPQLRDEILQMSFPFVFAFMAVVSLSDLQMTGVLSIFLTFFGAQYVALTRRLMVEPFTTRPERLAELMEAQQIPADRWWNVNPCCCLEKLCHKFDGHKGDEEVLKQPHFRRPDRMISAYVLLTTGVALYNMIQYFSYLDIVHSDNSPWCTVTHPIPGKFAGYVITLQGMATPFCIYSLNVTAKALVACAGGKDRAKIVSKANICGIMTGIVGLGGLLTNGVDYGARRGFGYKGGFTSVVFDTHCADTNSSCAVTLFEKAVGCPVYDPAVMKQLNFCMVLCLITIPIGKYIGGLVSDDDFETDADLTRALSGTSNHGGH